jgi:hypothetical protein
MGFRRFFTLALVAALPLACSDKAPTQPVSLDASSASAPPQAASSTGRPATRSLPARDLPPQGMIGTWGGQHLTITIGAASTLLSYDCAHGTIDQPFVVDSNGNFDLLGTHVPESPGPIREGDPPVSHPARYTGTVDGKTMTFTVTETDIGEKLGPFVLTLGVAGRIVKCY